MNFEELNQWLNKLMQEHEKSIEASNARMLALEKDWAEQKKQNELDRKQRDMQEALAKIQKEEDRKQREEERKQEQEERKQREILNAIEDEKMRKSQKRLDRQIGEVTGSYGREAEYMFYRSLKKHRTILGVSFERVFIHVQPTKNSREYDIILTNGDYIALVEVKRTASTSDVLTLVNEQAKDLRNEMTEYKNKKMICVLAAYTCIDEVVELAKKMGVCVLLKDGIHIKEEVGILKYF